MGNAGEKKDNEEIDSIEHFVKGDVAKTGGLHFIGTPDTKELVIGIVNQIQGILDLHMKNSKSMYDLVSYEILDKYRKFANGEMCPNPDVDFSGKNVYVVSDPHGDFQPKIPTELINALNLSTNPEEVVKIVKKINKILLSFNDKYLHDLLLCETVRNNYAETVNLVQLSFGYARQDEGSPGEMQPQSLKVLGGIVSDLVGPTGQIIVSDAHNSAATKSAIRNTVNLLTGWFIKECIKRIGEKDLILSPTDEGSGAKVKKIAEEYGKKNIMVFKTKKYTKDLQDQAEGKSIKKMDIYGNIRGKDVLIIDDMLDTGGTMITLIKNMLKQKPRSINIAITHGMFNGDALQELEKVIKESNGVVKKVFVTNSINKEGLPDFVDVVDSKFIVANNILVKYKKLSKKRPKQEGKKKDIRNNGKDYLADESTQK